MAKLKFAFRCLLSLALLVFVARKVNWHDLGTILSRIDWHWALPASLLTSVLIVALAVRWRIFLREQQVGLPFTTVLSLTWAGQFFNSFLPGSTGGDVFKIYQVCRLAADRKAAAVASVVVDRLSALFALVVFAAIAFVIEPAPLRALVSYWNLTFNPWWIVVLGLVGAALLWIAWRALASRAWAGRVRRTVAAGLENLRPNAAIFVALLLAFAIHFLNFLIVYFLARSLGIAISLAQTLCIMPVVLLLVMLPVTVNGHGLREVLLIAYFRQLSVHTVRGGEMAYQEVAIALSLLMVTNDLLWSLPGGLQYLFRFRAVKEPHLLAKTM